MLPAGKLSFSLNFWKSHLTVWRGTEAATPINPAYRPLTDTNRGHISRLTSKMHQGQGLKRPVGAGCIQKHVTGRSGACRHR